MRTMFQTVLVLMALSAAVMLPAAEPAPPAKTPGAPTTAAAPAAPAPTTAAPATPAGAKPAPGAAQSAEPDRIDPTEKVRADSEISFPVDI